MTTATPTGSSPIPPQLERRVQRLPGPFDVELVPLARRSLPAAQEACLRGEPGIAAIAPGILTIASDEPISEEIRTVAGKVLGALMRAEKWRIVRSARVPRGIPVFLSGAVYAPVDDTSDRPNENEHLGPALELLRAAATLYARAASGDLSAAEAAGIRRALAAVGVAPA